MSTFDERLRLKLTRLDAAIPVPVGPVIPAPQVARRPRLRRRQGLIFLAAAVGLLTLTAIGAVASQLPRTPAELAQERANEARVLDDLAAAIGDRCLSVDDAKSLVRQRLDALGLGDWTVRDDGRTAKSPCVGAAVMGENEVVLMPSIGGATAAALDALDARLLKECLGRDAAVAALRATLTTNGIADPRIEVTGVRQVPISGGDAFLKHVAAGCYVYGHAQFDQEGSYTRYISGP